MALNDENFYINLTKEIELRGKRENSFLEEAIRLREKCTSAMFSFQDLVHPKKWVTMKEMRKKIDEEVVGLEESALESSDDKFNPRQFETISQEYLNEINKAIQRSEDFLGSDQNNLNTA